VHAIPARISLRSAGVLPPQAAALATPALPILSAIPGSASFTAKLALTSNRRAAARRDCPFAISA